MNSTWIIVTSWILKAKSNLHSKLTKVILATKEQVMIFKRQVKDFPLSNHSYKIVQVLTLMWSGPIWTDLCTRMIFKSLNLFPSRMKIKPVTCPRWLYSLNSSRFSNRISSIIRSLRGQQSLLSPSTNHTITVRYSNRRLISSYLLNKMYWWRVMNKIWDRASVRSMLTHYKTTKTNAMTELLGNSKVIKESQLKGNIIISLNPALETLGKIKMLNKTLLRRLLAISMGVGLTIWKETPKSAISTATKYPLKN